MGATSVTGAGLGAADGQNKGSEHMTLGVNKLIGPRIVAAGHGTLSGGTLDVVLPQLDGVTADYGVIATDVTAANAVGAVIVVATDATTITLTGTSTDVITWAVVKLGL